MMWIYTCHDNLFQYRSPKQLSEIGFIVQGVASFSVKSFGISYSIAVHLLFKTVKTCRLSGPTTFISDTPVFGLVNWFT